MLSPAYKVKLVLQLLRRETLVLSPICNELSVEMREDIMYSISSQIGATEQGLLGQHLASTVLADIRLVCVLSFSLPSFSVCFVCLSLSLCGSLILSFSVLSFGTVLIQMLWAVIQLCGVRQCDNL